jgi:hypothetical protein
LLTQNTGEDRRFEPGVRIVVGSDPDSTTCGGPEPCAADNYVRAPGVFCFPEGAIHMSHREVVLVDLTTASELRICLRVAAEPSELHVEDIEWALEEYGICDTDRYRIIDTE